MYRGGLDRFKKAQSLEPFSVSGNSAHKASPHHPIAPSRAQTSQPPLNHSNLAALKPTEAPAAPAQNVTQVGGGQSTWQPPDWAIEPLPGVFYLEVLKDGEVLDRINLDKRRHIFGRQFPVCDFVLDHQSVSRQHAAVVPHRNGSIYVIDLGSAHGTFVANERLAKDSPLELEAGQSLRFAASTRSYILRKNTSALFPTHPTPAEINLPSPPDPSDEEAVLAYNTILNRYGLSKLDLSSKSKNDSDNSRPSKRARKLRVVFKDQVGEELVKVVGISDGADVETEPGPLGVKEGSLVGKYESLVQVTVIPKGKEKEVKIVKENNHSPRGVTDKLQQVLNRVKTGSKSGIYDDLYGDSLPTKVGSSWAYSSSVGGDGKANAVKDSDGKPLRSSAARSNTDLSYDEDDDLFGD
ncbi:hypothetical protein QJS04_geneDACA006730 [Acorus gramineus]|uniref:FHA domain-containing protein n=1 Tax=Acorus gramineus TaxID=55184 RepID=A0AAV9AUU8_ACOGR|nr:hypothetical protein QJS04_geneDACA006730 [Acorus gramineus]